MPRIMWPCWDGGGNLTPSLGIARVLQDRGHEVHFFGRPDMVHRVEVAGLRLECHRAHPGPHRSRPVLFPSVGHGVRLW